MDKKLIEIIERVEAYPSEALIEVYPNRSETTRIDRLPLADLLALADHVKELEMALEHYEDTCSECGFSEEDHDEDGWVDTMDEYGRMSCGHPNYPAQAALRKESGE